MTLHLECGRDFEVSRNCTTTTLFFGKRTTKDTEGKDPGTPDAAMHRLHICCTMWENGSLWSSEMRNFSAAECGKAITGNLRNVPHLIFRKLPLDNFPHSAIRIPQNTHTLSVNLSLKIDRVKWRHISMVAIRSPFCRSTPSYCA